MSTLPHSTATPPGLPLVVQLSFAGSRSLFDAGAHPNLHAPSFHAAVQTQLISSLRQLPADLRLSTDRHFICGLSALAIGADTLFTRALQDLGWPQRLLLPQQREDFLNARSARGTPDFTDAERIEARGLFASPHIIHERVVSDSPDRHTRFHDVNLELVRISDVVVCLVDATAIGKPGGTREVMRDAARRKRPMLAILVSVGSDGQPQFRARWCHRKRFTPPGLPPELKALQTPLTGIPGIAAYCQPLKDFGSRESKLKQLRFKITALVIIGTHVLATGCAVLAMKPPGMVALPWLLGVELALLLAGYITHLLLHHGKATGVWAMSRLVAELARSGLALREVPGYLSHLFALPLPASLRPLLRTLNVLHLRETRSMQAASWPARRDRYVSTRLTQGKGGQIAYYEGRFGKAKFWSGAARWAFLIASGFAIVATLGELLLACKCVHLPETWHHGLEAWLGPLAIVLPVLAVAALSFAASLDLEARVHTYREMLDFLNGQTAHLKNAPSDRAFCAMAMEAEARLLGETASWHSRRAFTGVS